MATQSGRSLLRPLAPLLLQNGRTGTSTSFSFRGNTTSSSIGSVTAGSSRAYHACFSRAKIPTSSSSRPTTRNNTISAISRSFASDSNKPQVVLQRLGDFPYGSREYRLVFQRVPPPQQTTTTTTKGDNDKTNDDSDTLLSANDPTIQKVASLRAHRNILFGARHFEEDSSMKQRKLAEVCAPLLKAALEDASVEGEQPQAMATLHGLCDWVTKCLEQDDNSSNEGSDSSSTYSSKALQEIKTEYDDNMLTYHAIRAMATGIPREGHSVVGQGTFRDGEKGWEALAQEFLEIPHPDGGNKMLAEEVDLYRSNGGTVVAIEHLADTKPDYLRSAGGTMVRLFFL